MKRTVTVLLAVLPLLLLLDNGALAAESNVRCPLIIKKTIVRVSLLYKNSNDVLIDRTKVTRSRAEAEEMASP